MRTVLKYILVYVIIVGLCTAALTCVALIPKENIRNRLEQSAEYLTIHKNHFPHHLITGIDSSSVDEVADANLLNIAYFLDAEHPLVSVMRCDCYFTGRDHNGMLLEAVKGDVQPNVQYFRYWHGSLLFVRPLLLIWNIQQIYIFHCFVVTGLFFFLLILLFRHGFKAGGIALVISMIAVSLWVVPMCLEFTWMFLLMFVMSVISIELAMREKYDSFGLLFFITGMITIFLDFFTTETLTVLIPLLFTLRVRIRQGKEKNWNFAIKCSVLWGLGYVFMWAAKWGLASIVLGFNAFSAVQANIGEHLANAGYSSRMLYLLSVVLKNIYCLFPISYGFVGAVFSVFVVFFCVFLPVWSGRVTLKKKIPWQNIGLYAVLGLIPYIRYIMIPHHSWVHYFFTYRAQAASVLALCFIVLELVEFVPIREALRGEQS